MMAKLYALGLILLLVTACGGSVDAIGNGATMVLQQGDSVNGAAWSSDDQRALTWSDDGTVKMWHVGRQNSSPRPALSVRHDGAVIAAAWNADESRIASLDTAGLLAIWDAEGGAQIASYDAGINGMVWNADGTLLLAWSEAALSTDDPGLLAVYRAQDGTALLHESVDELHAAGWTPDSERVLAWGWDGTIALWDVQKSVVIRRLDAGAAVEGVDWSPDGSLLLAWGAQSTVMLWDAASGEHRLALNHPAGADGLIFEAAISPDGQSILTYLDDTSVFTWDRQTGDLLQDIATEPSAWGDALPERLAWAGSRWDATGRRVLVWGGATRTLGFLGVWDLDDARPTPIMVTEPFVTGTTWDQQTRYVLAWSSIEPVVTVWDSDHTVQVGTARHDGPVNGAAWSHAGHRALTWSDDGSTRVWDGLIGQ